MPRNPERQTGALEPPIERVYQPPGPDGIVLYAGDLDVETDNGTHRVRGQLELELFPQGWFGVHFKGAFRDFLRISSFATDERHATVPAGARLDPPAETTLPATRPKGNSTEIRESLDGLTAGDISTAERFLVHFTGPLQPRLRRLEPVEGGHQGQIRFTLPGWDLTLAPLDETADGDFDGVIEARPAGVTKSHEEIDQLESRLFAVLGLVAGRELGIGPTCGLTEGGRVVWAKWGAPRLRPGSNAVRWCSRHLIPEALPTIASGYGEICDTGSRETVVERAIEMLLSADSNEVVDVRIPVAASGLELLSWTVLRGDSGMTKKEFKKLSGGQACRQLLKWAEIPTEVPDSLPALTDRLERVGRDDWSGPEIVFNVRNRLIHPPTNPAEPQWPTPDELVDAWQLATWYLQMVILRLLHYQGGYWSRLRLNRSEMDTEPVPWAR